MDTELDDVIDKLEVRAAKLAQQISIFRLRITTRASKCAADISQAVDRAIIVGENLSETDIG